MTDLVEDHRAAGATGGLIGSEHEVVEQELAAAVEAIGQRFFLPRRRKGKMLVTDGPFAETREWIGGF